MRSGVPGGDFRQLDLKDDTDRAALKIIHNQDDIEGVFAQHGAAYT